MSERPAGIGDQTAVDRDQAWSDQDQTASDHDQTGSDRDQTASDRDQQSSDDDQRASDNDVAAGGDPKVHRKSTLSRGRTSHDREAVSELRDETAAARLSTAEERDRVAALRDRSAEDRDAVAGLLQDDPDASLQATALRAARDRARAAADRRKAADDRVRAAADRAAAANDRAEALQKRAEAAVDLRLASIDELTGAWTRHAGLAEVARELQRARRTGTTLMLAFVDVDGLKEVNDSQGHLAGDALLRLVGQILRTHVRTYDVVVRYGGDEFVCAMPNLGPAEAQARLEMVAGALAETATGRSITFGLSSAESSDTLEEMIGRADAELLKVRRSSRATARPLPE